MQRLLIKGGTILSMDENIGDRANADILIEDGKIDQIGENLVVRDGVETIDASDKIVMPGLVDAHLHTWQTSIRGIAGNWSLTDYARNMHAGLATGYTPEDLYILYCGPVMRHPAVLIQAANDRSVLAV